MHISEGRDGRASTLKPDYIMSPCLKRKGWGTFKSSHKHFPFKSTEFRFTHFLEEKQLVSTLSKKKAAAPLYVHKAVLSSAREVIVLQATGTARPGKQSLVSKNTVYGVDPPLAAFATCLECLSEAQPQTLLFLASSCKVSNNQVALGHY